jgi:Ca-activated chloride channel homolog
MKARTRNLLLRIGFAVVLSVAIALVVRYVLIAGASILSFHIGGREIEFLAPGWLYLLATLPYIPLVRGESLTDLSLAQQSLSMLFRASLIAGITIAMTRPSTIGENDKVATVFLADVSESVSDKQLAAAQQYLEEAWAAKKKDDKLFVVTFAERPLAVTGKDGKPPILARHENHGAGTDIQAALQLAYGLYPPGFLPRSVIISDGNQTSGDILAEAYKAKDFGVKVSWKVFPEDRKKEIRVVSLDLPDQIKVGAPFEVTAEVWSTHEEEVTLFLRQDDFPNGLEPAKKVTLKEGINRIPFKSEAKAAGFTTYTLRISSPKEDENKRNNETVATAPVKGRPRILYIEGEYERSPQVASYLKKALDRENIDVEVRGARGAPSSAKELERFDLVLVSDVPSMFLGLAQMTAIETYVRDMGGGFIMAGGQDSFGSGGYQGTKIEKILPVRFDGETDLNQPQIALALVIDRSGSMSGEKLEMAKEAARATSEVLEPQDLVGVIAFDNVATTIVHLQKASNRLRISTDIARLQPGGGTNILPALTEAYNMLAPSSAKVKHAILLSDGQAAYEGIAEICDQMRANRITVSAVGIGDADRNLLQMVSEHGEGRFYMTDNAAELPRIFMKETEEVQKSSLVEDAILAHVVKRVDMIEGTGVENAPYLHGYVTTKPKPLSEIVLITDRGDPLLARWRVGIGQVVAWTSDVKNRWAAEWLSWPGYSKFFAQVVRSTMRHQEHDSYDLAANVIDGRARVVVDAVNRDDRFVNGLDTVLEVIDPRDSKVKRTIGMEQTAAGRYEADFPVDRYGSWILKAVHKRDGSTVAESVGAVSLPYPAEYLRTTPDEEPLRQAGVITGGLEQPKPAQIYATAPGEAIKYHKDLWPYVLVAVALAFLLDVYLRRVRLFGYRAIKF